MPTKEEAIAELSRRRALMPTRQEAIAELARRKSEEQEANEVGPLRDLKKALGYGEGLKNPLDIPKHVIAGLGKTGQGIASALTRDQAPTVNFDEMLGINNPSAAGRFIEAGAGYSPFGRAAGLLNSPKFLPQLAAQTAAGGAFGASQAKPGQENAGGYLPQGRAGGALQGAILNAITHGGLKSLEALRPSRMFRGNLTPEELQANLEATQGTNTGIGDVIGSPALKQTLENEFSDMPFSGTKQTMQSTAKQIQEQADKIASDLKLNEANKFDLHQALKDASIKAKNQKDAKFDAVNQAADKLNIKVGRDNFSKVASDELAEINASPELQEELPKDVISSLQRYSDNKEGNTLKRTDLFRGVLGDKANEYFRAGKDNLAGVMSRLKKALVDDRESAIKDSGNPTLKAMNDDAHKFYKENYAPFKHPDIKKFTKEGGDSDLLLPHFLKKGENDRSVLLSRLTNQLNTGLSQNQNLPSRLYLSKAMEGGKADPRKLAKLYNDLGENQKETLIPDSNLRKRLENYTRLVGLNSEPLDLMRNPKTGFRGVQSAVHTLLGIGGYGMGGPLGAAAGVIAPGLAMRPVVKSLTSPSLRESLVKAMIENRSKFTNKTQGLQTLQQALAQVLSQGNE